MYGSIIELLLDGGLMCTPIVAEIARCETEPPPRAGLLKRADR
jgi:hypothetical protein